MARGVVCKKVGKPLTIFRARVVGGPSLGIYETMTQAKRTLAKEAGGNGFITEEWVQTYSCHGRR